MDYLILGLVILFWLTTLCMMYFIRKNITLKPPMTPERAFSEAEIAAKSVGYWEKRGLKASGEEYKLCLQGLLKAQERLIMLTGDYVPDDAKKVFQKGSPVATLPPGVASLDLVRKSK